MNTRRITHCFLTLLTGIALLTACGPDDGILISTDIIRNANEANNYIDERYEDMTFRDLFLDAFVVLPILFSDNCYYAGNSNPEWEAASDFDIDPDNNLNWEIFADFYGLNTDLNILFAQIDTTDDVTLTDEVKDGFRAEGRAIRAMLYFYLMNYWGEVPLVDEVTQVNDTTLTNATLQELFEFIEEDLLFAEEHIDGNTYITDATRIGADAIRGFLARLYLQNGDWTDALDYADDVITGGQASLEMNYEDVFRLNSTEHLWVLPESRTAISLASLFLQPFSNGLYVLRPREAVDFEAGDLRRETALSVSGNTILKYTDISGNSDPAYLMRLAEMYLIAAEASARNGDYGTASDYLNVIRDRAGLSDTTLTAGNYEDLILRERNAELAYEGFHRLLDLRRFGRDDDVLGPLGYETEDARWPIPEQILDDLPYLEQNPGY